MKKIKKWLSIWKEKRSKEKNIYFGTSLFEEIHTNPFPKLIVSLFIFSVLYLVIPYIHYLGDLFYWLVSILEITKVLKIPFLDELRYFHYLSIFVFGYLTVSVLFDVASLLNDWDVKTYIVKNEIWQIKRVGIAKKLSKYSLKSETLQTELLHGSFLDFFGLNRLSWKQNGKVIYTTSFFSPKGKNKIVLNKLLNR
ncbi:hypothetical protein P3G55_10595 [Leptospira sp. 96542]|nr:hypothetical protein [Leptospira sp. 96542]